MLPQPCLVQHAFFLELFNTNMGFADRYCREQFSNTIYYPDVSTERPDLAEHEMTFQQGCVLVFSQVTFISWGKHASGAPSQHKILMSAQLLGLMVYLIIFFPFSQYPFELGLAAAFVFSTLVCLSRLYTGMHTVLVRTCLQLCFPAAPQAGGHASTGADSCAAGFGAVHRGELRGIPRAIAIGVPMR